MGRVGLEGRVGLVGRTATPSQLVVGPERFREDRVYPNAQFKAPFDPPDLPGLPDLLDLQNVNPAPTR